MKRKTTKKLTKISDSGYLFPRQLDPAEGDSDAIDEAIAHQSESDSPNVSQSKKRGGSHAKRRHNA